MIRTTLTALCLLFGTIGAIASPEMPRTKTLNQELKNQISYPEFAKTEKMDGMVLVEFEVTPNGELEVTQMNFSCPQLAKYVEKKLETIRVEDLSDQGKHCVKFNFNYVEG
jgi:hypothetical protein